MLENENFPSLTPAHGDWRDGVEPPCAGGYPTEIAGCMQCAQEALAQGICAADKGGAAMGSTGAGWGTMWARPHFPGSRHASWKCIRRLGFKYGLPELLRRIAWCRPAYRWMANDVSNLTVHCSPLGVKDMFVSMAMKMSRPEPSCGHGPDKTSANTV